MARDDNRGAPPDRPADATVDRGPDMTPDVPPSASISKARAGGQDSRATAHLGEDPDGPSTRITQGRRIAERIAEHEARVGHKELDEEEAIRFAKGARRRNNNSG